MAHRRAGPGAPPGGAAVGDRPDHPCAGPPPAHQFAYARPWLSHHDRLVALDSWGQRYNTRRAHSALGGRPPITRPAA